MTLAETMHVAAIACLLFGAACAVADELWGRCVRTPDHIAGPGKVVDARDDG